MVFLIHIVFGSSTDTYNSTSGPRRKDERGVKGVRVLAAVGTTMSKGVCDTGVLWGINGEELYKNKGTGLGVAGKQHIVGSCV